jgi:hypothetical protein
MSAEKPTSYDELYPGRFLKAGVLNGQCITLKITRVFREAMPQDDETIKQQGIVEFHPDTTTELGRSLAEVTQMQMALNSTNGQCFLGMWGPNPQNWVGHWVTLCPEEDYFGREKVPCIRIYGSPDLEADKTVTIKLPRKKPRTRLMHKTQPVGKHKPAKPSEPPATPEEYAAFLQTVAAQGWEESAVLEHCQAKWNVDPKTLPIERLVKLAEALKKEHKA